MRQPLVIAFAAVLAACGNADSSGPAIAVTDSAGIEIVTNPGDISGLPVWRVDTVPLLSIGLVDGAAPYLLDRVNHALVLDDGRIAVVNRGTDEIRLFDAQGRFISAFGADGAGPGEYRLATQVRQRGDSLVVTDMSANRVTVQPLDGSSPRTVPGLRDSRPDAQAWVIGDAVIMGLTDLTFPDPGTRMDAVLPLVRVPLDGSAPDTVAVLSNGVRETRQFESGGRISVSMGPIMFNGRALAAVLDDRIIAGNGHDARFVVLTAAGDTERVMRWAGAATPVTGELVDEFIDERIAEISEPAEYRRAVEEAVKPDSFPRFDAILAGNGQIWLRRFRLTTAEALRRWWVHDGRGRLIAIAEVPESVTIYEIGTEGVVAVMEDELDVEHVVILPVRKVE